MSAKVSPKSDLDLARSSSPSNGLRASQLTPLSTYLVLYLFFSAQVVPRSSAAQKFYPNGRYGRRSDLPPLLSSPLVNNKMFSNTMDSMLSQDILSSKDSLSNAYGSSNIIEEYLPMWCAEIDRKANLFKCFDRFPVRLLKQPQDISLGSTIINRAPIQQDQQDQQS